MGKGKLTDSEFQMSKGMFMHLDEHELVSVQAGQIQRMLEALDATSEALVEIEQLKKQLLNYEDQRRICPVCETQAEKVSEKAIIDGFEIDATYQRCRDCERTWMTPADDSGIHLQVTKKMRNARTEALAQADKLAAVMESFLWIDECKCDQMYLSRNRHEPNALCGELDRAREALAEFKAWRGT
jgi:uncharacterized protein with PIN domain